MRKNYSKQKRGFAVLLFLAFIGLLKSYGQSELDFSQLSEDNPATTLSITEGYKEAIANNQWTSVHTPALMKWSAPYTNDLFQNSYTKLNKFDFKSYLISPALNLSAIGGSQLGFEWDASTVKGEAKLQVLLIDKAGNHLATIEELVPASDAKKNDWKSFSKTIPTGQSGVGFLAFYVEGSASKGALFRVRNINLQTGALPVSITATPSTLEFSETNVGETSYSKNINVLITSFTGAPTAILTKGDTNDFTIVANSLTATGGLIDVYFTPKSNGAKEATLTINADDVSAEVTLKGTAAGAVVPEGPTTELLEDPYFYLFTDGLPTHWNTEGTVTALSGTERYNSSSGMAVGLVTNEDEGLIRQVIDLKRADKIVADGDELECLIHYYTVRSEQESGPFRLALRWLDASGQEIVTSEKDFINNPDLYFGRMKAYGALKFRTICPAGAEKLDFTVEVAPNSSVRFDDFSVLRLEAKDKTPLVAMLPQYRTIVGEVGVAKEYPIAIQGAHLADDQLPNFNGTDADNVLKLNVEKLPKNGTTKAMLTVTPTKKGVYAGANAYSVRFDGAEAENTGSLMLIGYFKAAGTTPTMALKAGTSIREMKTLPSKSDEQSLEFDINDVITSVDLALVQPANGAFRIDVSQFYYAQKAEQLYQKPVKVTFNPKEVGEYEATLILTSMMADTLRLNLKGVCTAPATDVITENFTADQTMDARFKGEAWKNYHKFDLGYWKLEGTWNGANNVTLKQNGVLYYDEILSNGVATVAVEPSANATNCTLEYSIDGGGHWTKLAAANASGEFTVDTHRPTFIRFVAKNDVELHKVVINPNKEADRLTFTKIEDAMIKSADNEPVALLSESFTNLRHTRVLGAEGWQNLTLRGERPFYAWQQKNTEQTMIENEVAQISFMRYGKVDQREHETWLISPTISYQKAASKILTFSLRFQNPTEDGREAFGLYIITEKDGTAKEHYLDLVNYAPANVTVEAETWYDYRIDLSKVAGLEIDDNFHVAYSFYSPVGGNETSLTFMIDEVTFGRTDLPEIKADKDFLYFNYRVGVEETPQVFTVSTERATAPVTVTLVPSLMKSYFKVAPVSLPAEGGVAAVGYKSDDDIKRAAMLLIQTRGAEPFVVKLFAEAITSGITDINGEGENALTMRLTEKGIEVKGAYKRYELFAASGQLLKQGTSENLISVDGLKAGVAILKLTTESGIKTFALQLNTRK